MEDERENEGRSQDKILRESVRVQKTLYMQEQLSKRRQTEERLLEQLLKDQRRHAYGDAGIQECVLPGLCGSAVSAFGGPGRAVRPAAWIWRADYPSDAGRYGAGRSAAGTGEETDFVSGYIVPAVILVFIPVDAGNVCAL